MANGGRIMKDLAVAYRDYQHTISNYGGIIGRKFSEGKMSEEVAQKHIAQLNLWLDNFTIYLGEVAKGNES